MTERDTLIEAAKELAAAWTDISPVSLQGQVDRMTTAVEAVTALSALEPEPETCRECKQPLLPENVQLADGCPCNSGRGINHGIVAKEVCTCPECDPAETGSSRIRLPARGITATPPHKRDIQSTAPEKKRRICSDCWETVPCDCDRATLSEGLGRAVKAHEPAPEPTPQVDSNPESSDD